MSSSTSSSSSPTASTTGRSESTRRSMMPCTTQSGPRESVAQLDELGRGAVLLALASVRELADLAVRSQSEAVAVIRRRLDEDMAELHRLLGAGR